MRRTVLWFCLAVLALAGPARAEDAAFWHGRTLTIAVGYSVGGGYDNYARVLGRFLGAHLAGNPTVLVEDMPGAGSLKAAMWLYAVAPRDGSAIGTFSRGMAMEPLLGNKAARFDATQFGWIGSIANEASVCVARSGTGIATWQDVLDKDFTVTGEGSGSDPDIFAQMLKNELGARIRLITGFPGTGEMTLALDRREVMGRCGWSWSSLKAERPEWINEGGVAILAQMATVPSADLPSVPLIIDLAKTERQRAVLRLILSRQVLGRPFAAPPGLPPARLEALRAAFDATMQDPAFLAAAKTQGLEVAPVSGADLQKQVQELYTTPPDVQAEARAAIGR